MGVSTDLAAEKGSIPPLTTSQHKGKSYHLNLKSLVTSKHKCSNPTHLHQDLAAYCCFDGDGFNCQKLLTCTLTKDQVHASFRDAPIPSHASIVSQSSSPLYSCNRRNYTQFCSSMEFKPCSIFTVIFLLILLVTPCFSRGMQKMDPEVYVIDYRGPETHSYIPLPNRSGGRPHIHHRNSVLHGKSKDLRTVKGGAGRGKKIHA